MGDDMTIIDNDGNMGRLLRSNAPDDEQGRPDLMTVALDERRRVSVPREHIFVNDDGSYRLDGYFDNFDAFEAEPAHGDDARRVPVAREHVDVKRRRRPVGRVRIDKRVDQEEVEVNELLKVDEAHIERVPVNQVVDEAPRVRREGDTLIVPVVEERLVKQLVLVEEVRIERRERTEEVSEPVTLRREQVDIERERLDSDTPSGDERPGRPSP